MDSTLLWFVISYVLDIIAVGMLFYYFLIGNTARSS